MPSTNEAARQAQTRQPQAPVYGSAGGGMHADPERWLRSELGGAAVPPLLVVIGLGDGRLLDVLDRLAPATRVLAVEPDAAVAAACLARPETAARRQSGRLTYLSAPAYAGADQAWRVFPASDDGFRLLAHPALTGSAPVGDAAAVVKKIVFGVRANAEARRKFAPRYLDNVLRNLAAIAGGRDVQSMAGRLQGVPAVITAAGPSLDTSLGELAGHRDRAIVIAADTTLRPLLHAGIVPEFVVGADPGLANARHFQELPAHGRTWLVAESALDASAAEQFADRTLWFRVANHHPWPWLTAMGVQAGVVEMWGSVLTAAFQFACLAGCDPIVLVGADLAFTHDRPYCRGTTYEFDWAYEAARGVGLQQAWQAQMSRSQRQTVKDVHGADVATTKSLISFRDWMVATIGRSGRRVINATGGGILEGHGVVQATLSHALAGAAPVGCVDLASTASAAVPPGLATRLRQLADALGSPGAWPAPLADWKAFSGDGFDAGAIAATLRRSADGIECAPVPRPAPMIDWAAVAGGHGVQLLPRLVESLVTPRTPANPGPAVARGRDHVDAVLLLRNVFTASPAMGALPVVSFDRPVTSIALRYGWPEPVRWALQLFESVTGGAAVSDRPDPATGDAGALPAGAPAPEPARATRLLLELCAAWLARVEAAGGSHTSLPAQMFALQSRLDDGAGETAHVTVRAEHGDAAASATLGVAVPRSSLEGALTGTIQHGDSGGVELRHLAHHGLSITVQPGDTDTTPAVSMATVRPLVLTDAAAVLSPALRRSRVAYPTCGGVVCVTPYERRSLLVRADGTVEPHLEWPRPIVGELAFGDGAVAWDNGLSPDGSVRPPAVMFRRRGGPVTVQPIPVRPTIGAWWGGRVYWSCYPTPLNTWTGVASWAPGEDVRLDLPHHALYGLVPHADGLHLEPCAFRPNVGFEVRTLAHGWVLQQDGVLAERAFDRIGVVSARAAGDTWTASVLVERNLILFQSRDGRATFMRCHQPLEAAWIGGSLLVSTRDREVLLFRELCAALSLHAGTPRS